MHSIGDTLGRYIDKSKPKDDMFACAIIFVELDIEKGSSQRNCFEHG